MPNIPHDNANAEKIDDDDLFNFDLPKGKIKLETNTDYYHDIGAFDLTPITPVERRIFTEQDLGKSSDIVQVTLEDLQKAFERTTINDIKLGIRKWDTKTVTEGEGLRYPTYPYRLY